MATYVKISEQVGEITYILGPSIDIATQIAKLQNDIATEEGIYTDGVAFLLANRDAIVAQKNAEIAELNNL